MNVRSATPVLLFAAIAACGGPVPAAAIDAAPGPGSSTAPGDAAAATASPCAISPTEVTCPHQVTSISDSVAMRPVAYAVPLGTPPAAGWPVALLFQGSFAPGAGLFSADLVEPFGGYQLALTISALLADGYAVIAPDASGDGTTFWETNIAPYAAAWPGSPDDVLMHGLLAAIGNGSLGALDASRLYATGISSGGFMTSRMAVSYPGQFHALADVAGSYATCSAICAVPTPLPADHPPILLLHGDLDTIVPATAVEPYVDALTAQGLSVQLVTDAAAGHQWLSEGVADIPAWFDAHP